LWRKELKKLSSVFLPIILFIYISCLETPLPENEVAQDIGDITCNVYGIDGIQNPSFINTTILRLEANMVCYWNSADLIFIEPSDWTSETRAEVWLLPCGFPGRQKNHQIEIHMFNEADPSNVYIGYHYVNQNNRDGLRQEYIDILDDWSYVPSESEFTQNVPPSKFTRLLDNRLHTTSKYENGIFDDICNWHEWWILGNLVTYCTQLDDIMSAVWDDFDLRVTAGYRCPVGNEDLSGSAKYSAHQFGRAFDYNQNPSPYTVEGTELNCYTIITASELDCNLSSYLRDNTDALYFLRDGEPPLHPFFQGHWVQGHLQYDE
jgi:hypothetical protein